MQSKCFLALCMLIRLQVLFLKKIILTNDFRNAITFSNSLDPCQAQKDGPKLFVKIYLQMMKVFTSRQRVK